MTGTQRSNVHTTWERVAKSTLNNPLRPLPLAESKPKGKHVGMESNIYGSSVVVEPLKQCGMLLDVSNICKEAPLIDRLKKPKEIKVVSHNANAKGRGRGFPQNNKITREAKIKKETSPAICNVNDGSVGNAISVDKENFVSLSRKEIIFLFYREIPLLVREGYSFPLTQGITYPV